LHAFYPRSTALFIAGIIAHCPAQGVPTEDRHSPEWDIGMHERGTNRSLYCPLDSAIQACCASALSEAPVTGQVDEPSRRGLRLVAFSHHIFSLAVRAGISSTAPASGGRPRRLVGQVSTLSCGMARSRKRALPPWNPTSLESRYARSPGLVIPDATIYRRDRRPDRAILPWWCSTIRMSFSRFRENPNLFIPEAPFRVISGFSSYHSVIGDHSPLALGDPGAT
jgi:hypothetical protein